MGLKAVITEAVDSAKHAIEGTDHVEGDAGVDPSKDAIEVLKEDHRRVEKLFEEILSEDSLALKTQRKNIVTVLDELTLHAKIEESIVYPAVYGKTKRNTDERLNVLEAYEEHGSMKDLMRKIARSSGNDESLKAKVQVLSEITEHHVKEEESTFFPEAKKLLGEKRLREIGLEIQKIKARSARRTAAKATRKRPASTTAKQRK